MRRYSLVPSLRRHTSPEPPAGLLCPRTCRPQRRAFAFVLLLLTGGLATSALQAQGSSSSSGGGQEPSSSSTRIAQPEASGSAVTLETSEPLFDLAVALNTCGYDADLAASSPVRAVIRREVAAAVAATPEAEKSHQALCTFIRQHTLADTGLNIAQYVSLSLYTSPNLTPTADETELPPDSTQVVTVLPLLHNFADAIHLHAIWVEHRSAYTALTDTLHDPLTKMILNTNIYLRASVSSYDGRRFLVLLEPMLAPTTVNARIYGSNYIVAISPSASGTFHLEQIRHTYLHYEVEPIVYARASAMERLSPLLKAVQNAPIDFVHKSDIVALIAECLIKAIEARTMDTGVAPPVKPAGLRERVDFEKYDAARNLYERQNEATRRNAADLATRHGWVLTTYFYQQLLLEERSNVSLKENIGQMVYGMDVDRQRHAAEQVDFLPEDSHEFVRRVAPTLTGLQLAELKLTEGDASGAEALANRALADPSANHAQANYILARIALLERQPDEAMSRFQQALSVAPASHDTHTVAWAHIYLGRLYDVQPDRRKALAEYQAALAANDPQPDTRAAANTGLRAPFALPRQPQPASKDADEPLDPSGKAEKDAYAPSAKP